MTDKSWCPKCDEFHPHAPCVASPPMTGKSNSELVERATIARKILVGNALKPGPLPGWLADADRDITAAIDALERLEAENARLREALEPFSAKVAFLDNEPPSSRLKKLTDDEETVVEVSLRSCINARAALEEEKSDG